MLSNLSIHLCLSLSSGKYLSGRSWENVHFDLCGCGPLYAWQQWTSNFSIRKRSPLSLMLLLPISKRQRLILHNRQCGANKMMHHHLVWCILVSTLQVCQTVNPSLPLHNVQCHDVSLCCDWGSHQPSSPGCWLCCNSCYCHGNGVVCIFCRCFKRF